MQIISLSSIIPFIRAVGLLDEMEVHPVTLSGRIIRLEPLSEIHVPDLALSCKDDSIWEFMVYGNVQTQEQMRELVLGFLDQQEMGITLPFAVVIPETGRAVGMTRYLDIQPRNKSLEIGGTWYNVKYQRTGVNTEAKYLLLRHAFEVLKCVRVQLKADTRNVRSQKAIERLGAAKEGVLRKHMILPSGYIRDSVIYSVIDTEWPAVKTRLESMLERKPD